MSSVGDVREEGAVVMSALVGASRDGGRGRGGGAEDGFAG